MITETTWHERNRERLREYNREYRRKWKERDPEGLKAYQRRGNRANYAKSRETILAKGREYYLSRRMARLLKVYGVTETWYTETLAAQAGRCAICPTKEPGGKYGMFAIDHCHLTGDVRGLLCNICNRMLGMAKDSTEILTSAIAYLQKSREQV